MNVFVWPYDQSTLSFHSGEREVPINKEKIIQPLFCSVNIVLLMNQDDCVFSVNKFTSNQCLFVVSK